MGGRRKPNRQAEAVAIDWLANRPTLDQLQQVREELGYHSFRDAVAAHDRAERGVLDQRRQATWSVQALRFGDPETSNAGES